MEKSENGKKQQSKPKMKSVKKLKPIQHNSDKEGINQLKQLCVQEDKQKKGVKMPGNADSKINIDPDAGYCEGDIVTFEAKNFEEVEYYYWNPVKGPVSIIDQDTPKSAIMKFIVPEMPPMQDEIKFQLNMIKTSGETITESASITLDNITFVGFVATIQVDDTRIWFSLTHDNKGDEWVTKDGTRIWFITKTKIQGMINLLIKSCDKKLPIRIRASFDSSLQKRTFNDTYAVKNARILRDDLHFNV